MSEPPIPELIGLGIPDPIGGVAMSEPIPEPIGVAISDPIGVAIPEPMAEPLGLAIGLFIAVSMAEPAGLAEPDGDGSTILTDSGVKKNAAVGGKAISDPPCD